MADVRLAADRGHTFYSCFSVWAMPYYSLQLEMSPDYNERTNITAYRAYAQQFIQLASGWILALAALPIFSRLADGKPDMANGMRYISIGLGILTIVLEFSPVSLSRSAITKRTPASSPSRSCGKA